MLMLLSQMRLTKILDYLQNRQSPKGGSKVVLAEKRIGGRARHRRGLMARPKPRTPDHRRNISGGEVDGGGGGDVDAGGSGELTLMWTLALAGTMATTMKRKGGWTASCCR